MAAIAKSPEPIAAAALREQLAWRRLLLVFVVACSVEALILGVLATRRAVNADEGFYLVAGSQVLAGRRLYADFFFPQMPYLPFVEAAVLGVSGPSLLAGRMISVVAGALLAGMLGVTAVRRSGSVGTGIAIALAYAGNALVLSYVSIAKTYGLANLALVGAFLLAVPEASIVQTLIAGASAGLAVGTRRPSAAAAVVLLVWSARGGMRHALAFAAGAALASVPWLWLAAHDPQSFWFSNFGFHELRREITGMGPILMQKGRVVAKWVLLPQNLLLWVLALAGLWRRPKDSLPAVACAIALGAVYLAATPTYLEYFVQVTPFLLLAAVPVVPALLSRRGVTVAAAGLYLVGLVAARRAAPEDSQRGEKAQLWRLSTVRAVSTYVQAHSAPDERVLSWWEGYPFLAQRPGFVGVGFWESNAAKKLSPAARRRYHLLGTDDLQQLVTSGEPRLVVFPDGTWTALADALAEHYQPAARFGSIQVLERRQPHEAAASPAGSAA